MNTPPPKSPSQAPKKVGFFISSLILVVFWFLTCCILALIQLTAGLKLGGFVFMILPALVGRYFVVKAIQKRLNIQTKPIDPKSATPISSLKIHN